MGLSSYVISTPYDYAHKFTILEGTGLYRSRCNLYMHDIRRHIHIYCPSPRDVTSHDNTEITTIENARHAVTRLEAFYL